MKTIIKIISAILLISTSFFGQKTTSFGQKEYKNISDSLKQQIEKTKNLENKVDEIKRDQLNYQIEKDLLKETYSTNYNSINSTISIGLLFITIMGAIFGYIGFKNISEIKKEYKTELGELIKTKAEFEAKLKTLISREAEVNNKLQLIENQNTVQNEKIKLLELKEKITNLMNKKNYDRALDYIAIGLEMAENESELLQQKIFCYTKNGNYKSAIDTNKLLVEVEEKLNKKEADNAKQNLAELYILIKDFKSYKNIIEELKDNIDKSTVYFLNTFQYYAQNDKGNFIKSINSHLNDKDISPDALELNWDLDDAKEFSRANKNEMYGLFNSYLQLLDNEIELDMFKNTLAEFA